ncbi:MAG: hypothetical protein ACJ736_15075, partial [Streptomyces sp.]
MAGVGQAGGRLVDPPTVRADAAEPGATAAGIGSTDARRAVCANRTAHSSSGNSPAKAPAIPSHGSPTSWR